MKTETGTVHERERRLAQEHAALTHEQTELREIRHERMPEYHNEYIADVAPPGFARPRLSFVGASLSIIPL